MWKDDHQIAVSDTRHIPVDNLDFVLHLRKKEQDELQRPKSAVIPSSARLKKNGSASKPDILVPEVEKMKETGCRIPACLLVDSEIIQALYEVSFFCISFNDLITVYFRNKRFKKGFLISLQPIFPEKNSMKK